MNNRTLTVILLSYGDTRALETSLRALSRQSLGQVHLEILLLRYKTTHSGNQSESSVLEIKPLSLDRGLDEQVVPEMDPGELAKLIRRCQYFTFLEEGDYLSDYFTEAMLNAAEDHIVPFSQIVEVLPDCLIGTSSPINKKLLAPGDYALHLSECSIEILQQPIGKLFPTSSISSKHAEYIANRDWLSLQVSLLLCQDFELSKFPAAVGATYYRSTLDHRMQAKDQSENSLSHAFRELQKLQPFRKQKRSEKQEKFLSNIEAHFMMLIRDSWDPSESCSALQALADFPLRSLPWHVLEEPVDTVAIVANFAPYAGTAGLVAGKRIVSRGKRVDLISSVVSSRKKYEKDLLVTEPYIRNHKIHSPRIRGDDDVDFRHFLDDALATLELWKARGAEYKNIYSRSMMPHSHIVAAVVKRQNPSLRWTAEFSDPNSVDAQGKERLASFQNATVFPELYGWGTPAQQKLLSSDLRLYRWAELLPYFHADELLFTNENQKQVMLNSAPVEYRESIEAKSVVAHHPTLPPGYYQLAEPDMVTTDSEILLAYFGNFYDTRGLTEIIEALEQLSDVELERFRLVIYTGSREERIHSGFPKRVRQIMNIKPRLDFLTSLATMNCMDYLIVNDADTSAHFHVNPFLPSKVSDYKGSKATVWAIVEAGSVLSKLQFRHSSALGDTEGALRVLQRILDDHDSSLVRPT